MGGGIDPELYSSQLEYTEGQVRDRRASIRRLLRWETLLIVAGVGALLLVFLGSVAWRLLT